MSDHTEPAGEAGAAFQKIWTDSISRLMQTAFTFGPDSPPPEVMRQLRSGMFQALAQSWDEFMRSPQFLDATRQWMENAIAFRQMTNDFMAKVRDETRSPGRDDLESIMLSVRHLEKELSARIEQLSKQVNDLDSRLDQRKAGVPTTGTKRDKSQKRRKQ